MLIGLGAYFLLAFAQASSPPQPPAVPTPKDPKERIELGRKLNGLQGTDLLPWHLKATYEVFDATGKSRDKGTYEEWRISAKQYKLVFQSPAVALEEYGTDQGVFRTGGQDWPGRPLGILQEAIVQPIPVFTNPKVELKNFDRSVGKVKLRCTALAGHGPNLGLENADSYCFEPTGAILVYATNTNRMLQTLYQQTSLVHGHYLAREIQYFLMGKPWLTIHVDMLELLSPSAVPSLVVPAGLLPVERRANGSGGVVQDGTLVFKTYPKYPATAELTGVQGTVLLSATIGKDGHIRKLEALAGPPGLQQAALDAVRQWVYSPYLVDGEPVEVQTDVDVVFSLGR
jgi:TonB family protein